MTKAQKKAIEILKEKKKAILKFEGVHCKTIDSLLKKGLIKISHIERYEVSGNNYPYVSEVYYSMA